VSIHRETCAAAARRVVASVLAVTAIAGTAYPGTQAPPPRGAPADDIRPPQPVRNEPVRGEAVLPKGTAMAFGLDVGGEVQTGNWDFAGEVVAADAGKVTFRTKDGRIGHLAYRLPEERTIPLQPRDPIAVKRLRNVAGGMLCYNVQVLKGDTPILTASRQHRDRAPRDARQADRLIGPRTMAAGPLRETAFWGTLENKQLVRDSRYATVYTIPVNLKSPNHPDLRIDTEAITASRSTAFRADDTAYSLTVTESREVVPKDPYKGVVEGKGYLLEYVVMNRAD
jgi:hypothetical protein